MKRKLISLGLAVAMMTSLSANVFASNGDIGETNNIVSQASTCNLEIGVKQFFTNEDGTMIEYFLDDNYMPYVVENGQAFYTVLPLEHLLVRDEIQIMKLEQTERYVTRLSNGYNTVVNSKDFTTPELTLSSQKENIEILSGYTDTMHMVVYFNINNNWYATYAAYGNTSSRAHIFKNVNRYTRCKINLRVDGQSFTNVSRYSLNIKNT